jgi:hypothetical protein
MSRQARDDNGAVALLVALLAVILLGLSAFTADFGMAYANRQMLQTSADAAAFGAAGVYSDRPASSGCSTLLSQGQAAAAAEAAAKVAANDNNAAPASHVFTPQCVDNTLRIRVTASTNSPSFFGRLFGRNDYAVNRSATAVVGAASSVGPGTRPLALCSRDLLSLTTFPSAVMKFEGPNSSGTTTSDCPDTSNAGNWWMLRCPGETGNIADNLANGCASPVSLVPNQPAPGSTGLRDYLLNYCTSGAPKPASCLNAEPGNLRDSGSRAALTNLVNSEQMFFLPAFCGGTTCNPGAVTTDGGSNTIYPVFRIIAVRLCGYHLGNNDHSKMTGICANNPSNFNTSVGGPHRNYLLVAVQKTNVTGGETTSTCQIGDPCDTGLREIRMTE